MPMLPSWRAYLRWGETDYWFRGAPASGGTEAGDGRYGQMPLLPSWRDYFLWGETDFWFMGAPAAPAPEPPVEIVSGGLPERFTFAPVRRPEEPFEIEIPVALRVTRPAISPALQRSLAEDEEILLLVSPMTAWTEESARRWLDGQGILSGNLAATTLRLIASRTKRETQWYPPREIPQEFTSLRSTPHRCLEDALTAARSFPALSVVMGFSFRRESPEAGIVHVFANIQPG